MESECVSQPEGCVTVPPAPFKRVWGGQDDHHAHHRRPEQEQTQSCRSTGQTGFADNDPADEQAVNQGALSMDDPIQYKNRI